MGREVAGRVGGWCYEKLCCVGACGVRMGQESWGRGGGEGYLVGSGCVKVVTWICFYEVKLRYMCKEKNFTELSGMWMQASFIFDS